MLAGLCVVLLLSLDGERSTTCAAPAASV